MEEWGIVAVMLLAELFDVAVSTVSKAAMRRGMNDFVFVMYSNAFAASFLLPLTIIFYRKRNILPRLTCSIVGQLFVLGLLSCSVQLLYYFGIGYSSPTLASIMSDLIPAFTFILAILFSMEKLDCKSNSTRAKLFGTLVSVTGALIITLYKGLPIINNDPFAKLLAESLSSLQFDWVLGAALLAARSLLLSMAFIFQAWIIREYPAELIVVLIRCILVFILSVPASAISEKDLKGWRLRLDMELLAIGCSAVLSLSFQGVLHIWAIGKKGPVYVAMFKPLEIVFAVIMGIAFLGDSIYLGSVIGAAVIVIGFYGVIWGKSQEAKLEEGCSPASYSPEAEAPLLRNMGMEQ